MVDAIAIAFESLLLGITGVLLYSYIAFARMHPDVRRARLFIMSQRIHRFLLAFTIGFLAITLALLVGFAGIAAREATAVAAFVFVGAVLYGSLEILYIAHPWGRSSAMGPSRETGGS